MVLSEVVMWMSGGEGGKRGRIFILYSCFPRHNVPLYIVCACFYSDRQDGKFWEFCRHNGIYNHSLQDIRSPALVHVPSSSDYLIPYYDQLPFFLSFSLSFFSSIILFLTSFSLFTISTVDFPPYIYIFFVAFSSSSSTATPAYLLTFSVIFTKNLKS